MNKKSVEVELLSLNQVAEVLNCSRRHVQRLVCRRDFPRAIRLGRLRRWNKADLLAWVLRQRAK
jgi:excisionase family DNA binding protein